MSTPRYVSETERVLREEFPDAENRELADRVFGKPPAAPAVPELAARALPTPHLIVPAPAGASTEAVAFDVLVRGAEAARGLSEALRDGRIDSGEAKRLCQPARALHESLGALLALLAMGEAA